jgi:DNA-binding PadR family transcriptional regulator
LVLGVVRLFQPVHGYDVRRELLSWRAEEWANVSPGSIYNALKSLTKDGLLEVVGTEQAGARPERTTYRLTAEGQSELDSLLREAWWNVEVPLDPLMPAVSFLWGMRRDELQAALRQRIAQIEGRRAQTRFTLSQPRPETTPPHVEEMLRLMDARVAAEIEWANALLDKLAKGHYHTADDAPWQPGQPDKPAKTKAPAGKKRKPRRRA